MDFILHRYPISPLGAQQRSYREARFTQDLAKSQSSFFFCSRVQSGLYRLAEVSTTPLERQVISTKMHPIGAVSARSLAKIIGLYYALAGLFSVLVYIVTDQSQFTAPLGFLIPFLSAKLTFGYHRAHGFAGILWQILSFTLLYGLSGWLSGFLGGVAYNILSKHFGFQVEGALDQQACTAKPG